MYIRKRRACAWWIGISFSIWTFYIFSATIKEEHHTIGEKGNVYHGRNKTIVFIYATQRSGSNFLGKIFNQNPDAFYLYEPLLPYTTNCDALKAERLTLLQEISMCNFKNLRNSYQTAFEVTKYDDPGCMSNTVCFFDRINPLLQRYAGKCGDPPFKENSECGFPLKTDILAQLCDEADIVAYKILRLCSLEMFDQVYSQLKMRGYKVFLIHLVRDPRAILSSRLKMKLDDLNASNLTISARKLCSQVLGDLEYVEQLSSGSRMSVVTDKRYLRVRHEDVSTDFLNQAQKIYKFVGKSFPGIGDILSDYKINLDIYIDKAREKVFRMVRENKVKPDEFKELNELFAKNNNPYEMLRDPKFVNRKWRHDLRFEQIAEIQEICKIPMDKLGYSPVKTQKELNGF